MTISHWKLNKWRFEFLLFPAWHAQGKMQFTLGFFKILNLPEEGTVIGRDNYKGFWLRKEFNLPAFGVAKNF